MLVSAASMQWPPCPLDSGWFLLVSSHWWRSSALQQPHQGSDSCMSISFTLQICLQQQWPLGKIWECQGDRTQPQVRGTTVMADNRDEESGGGFHTSASQWVLLLGNTVLTALCFIPYTSGFNPDVSEHRTSSLPQSPVCRGLLACS